MLQIQAPRQAFTAATIYVRMRISRFKKAISHGSFRLTQRNPLLRQRPVAPSSPSSILITKHLKKGERIRIAGLGILQVRKRAARMGRNPATGEPVKIKASKKVAFRAAKDLKEAV